MEEKIESIKERPKSRKVLFIILRIIISAGLLSVLIVLNIKNLNAIPDILKRINVFYAVSGILFYLFGIMLEAPRWKVLLSANKVNVPLYYLANTTLVGFFFSTLLPTSIGGDAYRAFNIRKTYNVSHHNNIISIYLGRFFGIMTGMLWILLSFLLGMHRHLSRPLFIGTLAMAPFAIMLILITFFPKKFRLPALSRKIIFLKKFENKISEFVDSLHDFKSKKKEIFIGILLSLLANIFTFTSFYFIGLSLKIKLGYLSYMFIVPVMWSASNLPVTLGGFGVRENTLVLLLKDFNVDAASALTFSIIVLITNILIAVLGGAIYLVRNISANRTKSRKKAEHLKPLR